MEGAFPRHREAPGPKQRKPAPAPAPPSRPRRLFRPETRTRRHTVQLRPRLVSLRTRAGPRAELDSMPLVRKRRPPQAYRKAGRRGAGAGGSGGRNGPGAAGFGLELGFLSRIKTFSVFPEDHKGCPGGGHAWTGGGPGRAWNQGFA